MRSVVRFWSGQPARLWRLGGSVNPVSSEQSSHIPIGRGTLQNCIFVASVSGWRWCDCWLFYAPSPTQQNNEVLMRSVHFDCCEVGGKCPVFGTQGVQPPSPPQRAVDPALLLGGRLGDGRGVANPQVCTADRYKKAAATPIECSCGIFCRPMGLAVFEHRRERPCASILSRGKPDVNPLAGFTSGAS